MIYLVAPHLEIHAKYIIIKLQIYHIPFFIYKTKKTKMISKLKPVVISNDNRKKDGAELCQALFSLIQLPLS